MPHVTVVCATRNRPTVLREALLSIRRQTFTDFEVIVADDGSSEETLANYATWWKELDRRFTLHQVNPSGAQGSTPGRGRNAGIRFATGRYVAFLDHDDIWFWDDHLAVAVSALEQHGAEWFISNVSFFPTQPDFFWPIPPEALFDCPTIGAGKRILDISTRTLARVLRRHITHPSQLLMSRKLIERTQGFIEGLRTGDDINFTFRLAEHSRRALYRLDAAVGIRMPQESSFSAASSWLDHCLAHHQALLDALVHCKRRDLRRSALARQAWVLRETAKELSRSNVGSAQTLAREAAGIWPSVGSVAFWLRILTNSIIRS
jgi:GT2 family glycosyltransferase